MPIVLVTRATLPYIVYATIELAGTVELLTTSIDAGFANQTVMFDAMAKFEVTPAPL
jgi:hypothetical protein